MNSNLINAQVEQISPLTDSILQLIFAPERYIDYQAGQYLEILLANQAFCYSIANAPLGSHKYELHLRHSLENSFTQQLLSEIKKSGELKIRLPFGECHVEKLKNKPILFIAGGTGFAPIKAMIEQLLASGDQRPFELFWGARSQSDLYMNEKVMQWQAHVAHFRYFSLLSHSTKESLVSRVIEHHQQDLLDWQFVISGPFDMVYATRDQLIASGANRNQLFSDAFSFEKEGENKLQMIYEILGLIAAGLIVWILYRNIRGRPDQFSREKLNHSFSTMGFLALFLIGFVALLVFILRHS